MTRSLTLLTVLILALCLPACRDDDDRPKPTQSDVLSSARLEKAPLAVRTTFRQDHPYVTVSDVQTHSPQDGPLLYVITFYEGGRTRSASYTQDGALLRVD